MAKSSETPKAASHKKLLDNRDYHVQSGQQNGSLLTHGLSKNPSLNDDFEGQVNLLAKPDLSLIQRQEIAQKIGKTQGNFHLQKLISGAIKQKKSQTTIQAQRYRPTRPRLSDPEVISATSLDTVILLTFNMTWTRGEAISFLWPNGPNPPINFFMPDETDPWKTDAGEYQRFFLLPTPFVLQGIRRDIGHRIYELFPDFSAQSELPEWVPDEVKSQIQEATTLEGDFRLYGQWPLQDSQNARGLYWMRRQGRQTQIEVAQLPDPSVVEDRQAREARVTVNRYLTSYVVSQGMSISDAKAQTRRRVRAELIIAILEAIAIVIPARLPHMAFPSPGRGVAVPRARTPRQGSGSAAVAEEAEGITRTIDDVGEVGGNITRRRLFAQRNPTVADPTLPPGSGYTDIFGNMTISSAGSATDQSLARYHEQVHSFLSPRLNFLRNFRANLGMSAYKRSALLRYLEEALAETYSQLRVYGMRNLVTGIRFPIREGYVTLRAVVTEAAIGSVFFGGVEYGVYLWASQEEDASETP